MVDVEYQFTHPAGACFLCGGDVDRVRSPGDDTDGDATDPWDVPNNPWNVPNDPSMLGGPNGQLGNGRRRDYWMKYFRLVYVYPGDQRPFISLIGMKDAWGSQYRVPGSILWDWHHDEGFLIHAACWKLLRNLYDHDPVPIPRLWEVLRSISTYDARVPSWGHEYSLKPVRKHYYPQYPWRTCDIYGQKSRPDRLGANPCRATGEFASLLAAAPIAPAEGGEWDTVSESVDQSCDEFFRLPAEIRLEIGLLLGFDDVLALRLASKAFSFLFHDQQFWASRFLAPHGERKWLLEAEPRISHMIGTGKNVADWRWLFRQTRDVNRRSAISNFRRILWLAKQLRVILDLEFPMNEIEIFSWGEIAHEQPSAASRTSSRTRQRLGAIDWAYQPWVGELEDIVPQMQSTRFVYLSDDICRLLFSFVTVGDERYLAGIGFHARSTEQILQLGYKNPSEPPETVDIDGEFCGFELAVGSRGIQGILCVDGDGRAVGDWVGLDRRQAHKPPVTSRLVCRAQTKILAMKGQFDGLRFTMLSVASEHTVRIFEEKPYEFDEGAFTMRRNGVWYPGLPADDQGEDKYLHIWDEHALHVGRLCQGYKPLTWICFGGWGGLALRHITNMSVLLHGKFNPRQFTIKFSYDNAYDAQGTWRERHAMLSTRATAHPELEESFEEFPIDGAGGEFIINIGMLMHFLHDGYVHSAHRRRDFDRDGFPVGIEVKTNRARSKVFIVKSGVVRSSPPETYYLAPPDNEAPILGLYAGEISKTMGFQLGVLGQCTKST